MYSEREHMETTINELLLEAYKKSYEAQSSLVKVKDATINFLEAQIDELKLELSQCKKDSMSYTGLTDEEFKEIEKLTEEIMNDDQEMLSIALELKGEKVREMILNSLGIHIESKENTTIEHSDELKQCNICGVKAERINAKFCFHCGTKFD